MLDFVSFPSKSEPSDAIFRNPIVVIPDTSAISAIALMNDIDVAGLSSTAASQLVRLQIQARASCVAIVDREHYIGLLTAGDVVRLCARGQDLSKLTIEEAIGATSVTLKLADFTDLSIALDFLQRHSLSHLPVVDDRDCLVGILTSELLQYRVAETLAAQLEQSEAEKAELLENSTLDIQEPETELKRLSERLSLSLKSAAVGCWEWDIVNDALIWDDRTYELFGIDRTVPTASAEVASSLKNRILTYSNWSACLHPEDRQAAEAKIGQVLFCETEFELEYRVIHPDGNIKFIKAYGLVQRDDRDRPYRAVGIHLDISAAKQDEAIRLQTERTIAQQAEREFVLREMTQRIRRSLDLPTIFETAVQEIRQFLATDRVGIFKFDIDFNFDRGEFVAEAVADRFESILGAKIHDPGFGNKLAWFYQQDKINAVEDIHAAGLLDCEVRVLAQFQVRANLVVPLFNGPNLWGLLCLHHCATARTWQENEINFIKHIAEQIGIAIQQATLYEKVQLELEIRWRAEESIALKLRQQRTLGSIAQQIRNSLNIDDILATATAQVKDLMMVDRAIVCQISSLDRKLRAVAEVVASTHTPLVDLHLEREPLSNQEIEFYLLGQPRIVADVAQDIWSLRWPEWTRMAGAKSKIVAPILLRNDSDTQYWLDPSDRVQLWGTISVHTCSMPRDWQDAEAQLLQQIADQLAIAIQQASLFEQLQRELTEKQQAETQLLQSNQQLAISNQELARATRLKDEFLANMSHELRTPLNAVLGMSEGLHDEIFGSITDRQRSAISTISKSGKQLLSLIENILDLSTMAANNFQLETTDVSVASLCHNSLLLVKEIALKKQIKLRLELPDYLKHTNIQVDDRRFRQVLHDLLSNAVKFTPQGGRITLDVRLIQITTPLPDERFKSNPAVIPLLDRAFPPQQPATAGVPWQIAFSVVDTGIGIKPEHLSQLFQPFVQIDSSLNRQYAGTGLGLALVKRIAEMHGGSVGVQSQVDLGSCFTVSMPFCPTSEPSVPPGLLPQSPPPVSDALPSNAIKQHPVILIAEDNPANMETMTGYLESRGYRPIEAENGVQAIELARSRQPDIILMDIQMPDLNGFEAIAHLRQIPECAKIPIIALTALASPPDRQKCLDAGADRYVTKPVKLSQLVATIDTLINSK
jgi:signal transduction histidine kinase/CBS domain-containing protein